MKILFVVNPVSGGIDKEPFLAKAKALCEQYAIPYSLFHTTGGNDEKHLLEAVKKEMPDKIAALGGDGTFLFSAVTLLEYNIPIGIIPLGSANGMAMELYVNPAPMEALKDILLSQKIVGLDVVQVNNIYYSVHIGDVGINASIVEAYSKDKNRGMATYAKYFINELKRINPFTFEVESEGKTYKEKGVMLAICNARKFGTGVPVNVVSNPTDGKFELVLIKNIDLNSLVKAGLSKFNETFYDHQNSEVLSCTEALVKFESPRLLQLDGEIIGQFDEINIGILPGKVKFISQGHQLQKK
jgi:diacylglycerol kinase family enzyme